MEALGFSHVALTVTPVFQDLLRPLLHGSR